MIQLMKNQLEDNLEFREDFSSLNSIDTLDKRQLKLSILKLSLFKKFSPLIFIRCLFTKKENLLSNRKLMFFFSNTLIRNPKKRTVVLESKLDQLRDKYLGIKNNVKLEFLRNLKNTPDSIKRFLNTHFYYLLRRIGIDLDFLLHTSSVGDIPFDQKKLNIFLSKIHNISEIESYLIPLNFLYYVADQVKKTEQTSFRLDNFYYSYTQNFHLTDREQEVTSSVERIYELIEEKTENLELLSSRLREHSEKLDQAAVKFNTQISLSILEENLQDIERSIINGSKEERNLSRQVRDLDKDVKYSLEEIGKLDIEIKELQIATREFNYLIKLSI